MAYMMFNVKKKHLQNLRPAGSFLVFFMRVPVVMVHSMSFQERKPDLKMNYERTYQIAIQ